MEAGMTAKYVYGVMRPGTLRAVKSPGVNGGKVYALDQDDLAALVSDVPPGPLTGTKDDVLAHSRVLEEVVASAPVLPMRFGVVMDDADALRERLLDAHGDELRELLGSLGGVVQLRVRVLYVDDAGLREIVGENREIAQLRESLRGKPDDATYYDRIRLGELIAQELESKRAQDGDAALKRLEPLCVDHVRESAVHEQMVANVSMLVERARLDEVGRELEKIALEIAPRLALRTVGPLPPYSFVELPDASREESWA